MGWNAELYDSKHGFVSAFGSDVVEWLEPKEGERILDLGCGTGDITNDLCQRGAQVTGVDASKDMIEQARNKYPSLSFYVADAEALMFEDEFDAVFSNAVLHWIKTPEPVLDVIYRSLKSGGRFTAEFGGSGNVKIITDEIKRQVEKRNLPYKAENFPWYFPTVGEYTGLMEDAGFCVSQALHFERPTVLNGENGLRNWLHMFGRFMFQELEETTVEDLITGVEQQLEPELWNGREWEADYKRIRVKGWKR
ncbi:class I SAM-dependent methyltransferase [Salibacterium aidingense]|uniref:class I SAM-dependent methyltransferase n=1 Tax=Salibacterium aidingense TaxID=384933 RepID=UPI00042573F0|nr:class I SAM-dependent methyltransferase [Salibacterium aidingense]